jgi:uncharacterized glyoxalase superfamily protein PhnB
MRYRDIAGAVDWLCEAFGFEKQSVITGPNGEVQYAELSFGNAILMLAPVEESPLDQFMRQPDEVGGETQSCYFIVDNIDAHCVQARAAGAEIVIGIQEYGTGGYGYSCRDPEGHIWSFGTYDPWQGKASRGDPVVEAIPDALQQRPVRRWAPALMLCVAGVVAGGGFLWVNGGGAKLAGMAAPLVHEPPPIDVALNDTQTRALEAKEARLVSERSAREAAEAVIRDLQAELDWERGARQAAQQEASALGSRVAAGQGARETAEMALQKLRDDASHERTSRETAERAIDAVRRDVATEQAARQAAEAAVRDTRDHLERERASRTAVENKIEALQKRVTAEQTAREAAESATRTARAELASAQQQKETSGADTSDALKRLGEERAGREAAEASLAKVRQDLTAAQENKETAGGDASDALKRLGDERAAREAAEASLAEVRELLIAEQAAKRSAWNALSQLRRQMAQMPRVKKTGASAEAGEEEGTEPAPVAATKARPKQQPPAQRKRRPTQGAALNN